MLVALVAASSLNAAEWTRLEESEDITFYVDHSSLLRLDGVVRLTTLNDFRKPRTTMRGWIYRSEKIQSEFDCQRERWRAIYATFHSGQMGSGPVFADSYLRGWSTLESDPIIRNAWRFACDKK